jgi:hypothetical protein
VDMDGSVGPRGDLALKKIPVMPVIHKPLSLRTIRRYAFPRSGLSEYVNDWRSDNVKRIPFIKGVRDALMSRKAHEWFGFAHVEGSLFLKIIRASGEEIDLGLAGLNIVTTCGVQYIADAFRSTVEPEIMKFHGLGTGATAEVVGNTALQTELTTQYNPDSTRATGTLAGSTNVFTTVGVNTVDASASPTEWGLLNQAATGSFNQNTNNLLDRVTFTAVALANGDSLQTTFNLTFPSGG